MKSVGVITFHAAHNYGANLQAYALQKTIEKLGCMCEIINLRTKEQEEKYKLFLKPSSLLILLKDIYNCLDYKNTKSKHNKFEKFISDYMKKSDVEYRSISDIENNYPEYDYYISGSDQIWNTELSDFDWSYFLPFVKDKKRIAYAPSFGYGKVRDDREKIETYIKRYDCLSVRDEASQKIIDELIGVKPQILPDPTILLSKEEWNEMVSERIIKGEYIFLYTFSMNKETKKIVKAISRKMNIPVVISRVSVWDIINGFKWKTDVATLEFLSLVKNAKLVCTSSFHGTVFSIIFNIPFFAINGLKDNRISTLLNVTGLVDRDINTDNLEEQLKKIYDIDFTGAEGFLKHETELAVTYLKNALEIGENDVFA